MNLVGYARVSSEGQRENTSLQTQQESIIDYCDRFGHKLIGMYQDVESAATIEQRDGFQWAMRTVQAADGLLVYRLDRMTRNVLDGEKLKLELAKTGKVLLSVNESVNLEDESGSFMYTIGTAIAELERKRITSRAQTGRRAKRNDGGYVGGSPPYGYIAHKRTLMVHPHEQAMIEEMKRLHFESGWGATAIAHWLNTEGVRSKQGKPWSPLIVRRILHGDPPLVEKLRNSGKLLSAEDWRREYGAQGRQTQQRMDAAGNEAAS